MNISINLKDCKIVGYKYDNIVKPGHPTLNFDTDYISLLKITIEDESNEVKHLKFMTVNRYGYNEALTTGNIMKILTSLDRANETKADLIHQIKSLDEENIQFVEYDKNNNKIN